MKAYCYVLYSDKLNKFYIGSTPDIGRRLEEHNRGKEKFTKTGLTWKLIYFEEFQELKMARASELAIKKKKSRKYIEQLAGSVG